METFIRMRMRSCPRFLFLTLLQRTTAMIGRWKDRTTTASRRVGFAWSPGSSDRLVVRFGFGLFYNQAGYSINENLALNLPFYFNKTITIPVDQAVPAFTTANILLA